MLNLLFAKLAILSAYAVTYNDPPCPVGSIKHGSFFFLPPWWEYIPRAHIDKLGQCVPTFAFPQDIWLVALAVADMLLRVAGFVAVIMIIVAGITYMTALGNPEKAASSRRRLYNALIGLAIALIATGLVSFIGNQLGG